MVERYFGRLFWAMLGDVGRLPRVAGYKLIFFSTFFLKTKTKTTKIKI